MNKMESTEKPENQSRGQEIRIIWKQHQWLYIIVGFIIGLLFTALIQVSTVDFFLNLIPEALGIGFGVFVVDRLYRHWERQRLLKLIKKELIFNLSQMVDKTTSGITPACIWGMPTRIKYGENGTKGTTPVTHQQMEWLLIYSLVGTKARRFRTDFVDSALTSDTLLLLGIFYSSKEVMFHEALLELRNLVDKRKNMDSMLTDIKNLDKLKKAVENKTYQIPNMDILVLMACIDLDINIISWSKNIITSIDNGKSTVIIPKLQPISPIDELAKDISKEIPTLTEVEKWIRNWEFDW